MPERVAHQAWNGAFQQGKEAMNPSPSLRVAPFLPPGKLAGYSGVGAKPCRDSATGQLNAEQNVLCEMCSTKIGHTSDAPRERHTRAHQVTGETKIGESGGSDECPDSPGEFRDTRTAVTVWWIAHDIAGLNCTRSSNTGARHAGQRSGIQNAVGVKENDDVARTGPGDVSDAGLKSIPLPYMAFVTPDHDLNSCGLCDRFGFIAAVVSHHDQPVGNSQLFPGARKHFPNHGSLVVSGHKDNDGRTVIREVHLSWPQEETRKCLQQQHRSRNQENGIDEDYEGHGQLPDHDHPPMQTPSQCRWHNPASPRNSDGKEPMPNG
jgi:hypothetical protein